MALGLSTSTFLFVNRDRYHGVSDSRQRRYLIFSSSTVWRKWSMLSLLLLRTLREGSLPTSACSSEDTLRCNVVVCHAPHNQSSVEERVAFYELVGKVLRPSSSVGG